MVYPSRKKLGGGGGSGEKRLLSRRNWRNLSSMLRAPVLVMDWVLTRRPSSREVESASASAEIDVGCGSKSRSSSQ